MARRGHHDQCGMCDPRDQCDQCVQGDQRDRRGRRVRARTTSYSIRIVAAAAVPYTSGSYRRDTRVPGVVNNPAVVALTG